MPKIQLRKHMICTITSSFFFLFPIYLSHIRHDTFGVMMFSIAMGLSIANHSHSFTKDGFRRKLYQYIDVSYMHLMSICIIFQACLKVHFSIILLLAYMNYSIYHSIGSISLEHYGDKEKRIHVFFHIIGILSLTLGRYVS